MLTVHRFSVAGDPGDAGITGDTGNAGGAGENDGRGAPAEPFLARARAALAALAGRPGYLRGWVGRDPDAPTEWVLATEWDGIGAYRRALSSYEVKVVAHPLLAEALPGPGAFEVLHAAGPGGVPVDRPSGRAADAATASPGEHSGG